METSAAGPFGEWPLQRGFDRFYGFLGGETDHFHPELCRDNHFVDPPGRPEDGYHLTEDLIDEAIGMIRQHHSLVPERPFLTYVAFGATHAPHHAPDAYLEKYRGRFDDGWDVWRERVHQRQLELGVIPPGTKLAPRNPGVVPWDTLSADEQRFACRLQEAFAAFLDHTDAQIGRLLDALEELGIRDDTLIVATSDNGASQEGLDTGVMDEFRYFNGVREDVDDALARLDDIGTRRSFSNYPWGWAQVGNTPAKRYKQNTHGGGVRDPLIVAWPGGIAQEATGSVRTQFHHIIDIAPTLYDVCGIEPPDRYRGVDQQPIHGTSMAYLFDAAAADASSVPSRRTTQYFEMFGHRAIWSDGWKAVCYHPPGTPLDEDDWELYHLDADFSECDDLAASEPERLAQLIDRFWSEADTYGVLPIEAGEPRGLFAGHPVRGTPRARDRFEYRPPLDRVPADVAPALGARSWALHADLLRPTGVEDGSLLALGTVNNGLVVYVQEGHLVYDHNAFATHTVVRSPDVLGTGPVQVTVRQTRVKRGPARVALEVDGVEVTQAIVPIVPVMISSTGMDIGRNPTGISDAYEAPFEFAGAIERVVIETTRALSPDDEAAVEVAAALRSQ